MYAGDLRRSAVDKLRPLGDANRQTRRPISETSTRTARSAIRLLTSFRTSACRSVIARTSIGRPDARLCDRSASLRSSVDLSSSEIAGLSLCSELFGRFSGTRRRLGLCSARDRHVLGHKGFYVSWRDSYASSSRCAVIPLRGAARGQALQQSTQVPAQMRRHDPRHALAADQALLVQVACGNFLEMYDFFVFAYYADGDRAGLLSQRRSLRLADAVARDLRGRLPDAAARAPSCSGRLYRPSRPAGRACC